MRRLRPGPPRGSSSRGVRANLPASALATTLLATVVLASLPAADAQVPAGRNEVALSILEYHPYPDPQEGTEGGDPFGVPASNDSGGPNDRMTGYYGAFWFPTTRFDGVLEASYARDGTITNMREFYDVYLERFRTRLAVDSPLVVNLTARIEGDSLVATARWIPRAEVASSRIVLRTVLYEDDVAYAGGNGVENHRFLVRAVAAGEATTLRPGEPVTVERSFALSPAWKRAALGVVAFAQNEDETAPRLAPQEVLQSATYRLSQRGPTVQVDKAVLLEMATATWCPSCVYGDGAVDLLAEDHGTRSALKAAAAWKYFRAPPLPQAALAAAVGLATAALVVPRLRRDAP